MCYPDRYGDRNCDFCTLGESETVAHILNRCPSNKKDITERSEKAHQAIKDEIKATKRRNQEITYGTTIRETNMRKIPDDFERRPKPDMCIMTKNRGRRSKFGDMGLEISHIGPPKRSGGRWGGPLPENCRNTEGGRMAENTDRYSVGYVPGICTKGL